MESLKAKPQKNPLMSSSQAAYWFRHTQRTCFMLQNTLQIPLKRCSSQPPFPAPANWFPESCVHPESQQASPPITWRVSPLHSAETAPSLVSSPSHFEEATSKHTMCFLWTHWLLKRGSLHSVTMKWAMRTEYFTRLVLARVLVFAKHIVEF